ncbi:MAG: hypothetical protein KDE26_08550 [Bacteroidetes bacterium]|nr:hypothetical protein [Bacteroidota bacterium]
MLRYYFGFCLLILFSCQTSDPTHTSIDRKAVVNRHQVHIQEVDTLNSLSLGNGRFAMTMDVTGLQTFPLEYKKGMSLGTMSEWGWHSFPTEKDYRIEQTLQPLESHGRQVSYARQWPANTPEWEAANYIRQNPHRIHLATVGWVITNKDGSQIKLSEIQNIDQTLDMWKGELTSKFEVEGVPVEVISFIGQQEDILGVQVNSPLVAEGRMGIQIRYPYPTDQFLDEAALYDPNESKRLNLNHVAPNQLTIKRSLDTTIYFTHLSSSLGIQSAQATDYGFKIMPQTTGETWSFSCLFNQQEESSKPETIAELRNQAQEDFQKFWKSGGIIDFGNVEDERAKELERRMLLSLYLTKINCGGYSPPQETGLVYNSWYGKPHMEMIWWHGVHFALWGRPEILENQMDWYLRNHKIAREIAQRQGFEGVRWQKMTDPWGGETASSVGSYLIWQQPHFIYFSELIYRSNPDQEILDKYGELVDQTAAFMADFAWYDTEKEKYILGPGVIAAQERFDPKTTFNPTYEVAYWRWGLEKAQEWRERRGMARNEKWDQVLAGLSPLPHNDSLYLAAESAPDSYTTERYMTDHPSVLGAYGMLPATQGLDREIMRNTFNKIWTDWQWHDTWGWDFPMTAMTATRLNMPEKAVDALLMPIITNVYLKNGHNYQTDRLRLYLPGNGGVLIALAMMAAGTDETREAAPGFPEDWDVRFEGLEKMP